MKEEDLDRLDDLLSDFIVAYCGNKPTLEAEVSHIRRQLVRD